MNSQQLRYIKGLDPFQVDGTIQSILMREDISHISFEAALKFILESTLKQKDFLINENISLYKQLNKD